MEEETNNTNTPSYKPVVLEEHVVHGMDRKKIVILSVVAILLIVGGIVTWKLLQKDEAPVSVKITSQETLRTLAESSQPVEKTPAQRIADMRELATPTKASKTANATAQAQLQLLENLNNK